MKKLVIALTLSAIASLSIAQTQKVAFDTSKLKTGSSISSVVNFLKKDANMEVMNDRPYCEPTTTGSSIKFTPKVSGSNKSALIVYFCDDHLIEYRTVSN